MPPKRNLGISKGKGVNVWMIATLLLIVVIAFGVMYIVHNKYQPSSTSIAITALPRQEQTVKEKEISPPALSEQQPINVNVDQRDRMVLQDPLYPPYNRSTTANTYNYATNLIPFTSRDNSDGFRLVGYLVDQEDRSDTWKLFAREKYRGGRSEFYVSPSNRENDVKVFLSNDNVVGQQKFRDIYDIPDQVSINHPMFSNHSYTVVELPKSDFSSRYF